MRQGRTRDQELGMPKKKKTETESEAASPDENLAPPELPPEVAPEPEPEPAPRSRGDRAKALDALAKRCDAIMAKKAELLADLMKAREASDKLDKEMNAAISAFNEKFPAENEGERRKVVQRRSMANARIAADKKKQAAVFAHTGLSPLDRALASRNRGR